MEAWELDALERAAACLARARYVIALTGAGLSVESGIPPFRGPGGLWTKHGEPPMDGYQRFLKDPRRAWEDRLNPTGPMRELWEALAAARPNPGHQALVELEELGVLKCTITQNVDNLHRAAGRSCRRWSSGCGRGCRCCRLPRGEAAQRLHPPARVEAHRAAVVVVPGRPAAAVRLRVLRRAGEALDVGGRHAALDGAQRLVGGWRRLARGGRWGPLATLGGGERRVALLHLCEERVHALLHPGQALGQVLDARQHVGQALRGLGLGARGVVRAALLAPPGTREGERLRAGDLDLGLAVVPPDGAVHEDALAPVAALELGGRERVEAARLHDGGEAIVGGLEGEQAGERRAVDADHEALDRGLLADVLVGFVPRDRRLGGAERGERDDQRQRRLDHERAQA